jgi:hypothetical protein
MNSIIRLLGGIATALAAGQAFILAYPGDLLPQSTLLVIGALNAALTAVVVYLAKPAVE